MLSQDELVEELIRIFNVTAPERRDFGTAGELFEWVWAACQARYSKGANAPWFAACWGLSRVSVVEGNKWKGDTRLDSLLPRKGRARHWGELGQALPIGLPSLKYGTSGAVAGSTGAAVAFFGTAILIFGVLAQLPALSKVPSELWIIVWLANLGACLLLIKWALKPHETEIPPECATVNQLGMQWRLWARRQSSDYPPEQAVLWMLVRQIIADAAVCPLRMVRRETTLRGLGLE